MDGMFYAKLIWVVFVLGWLFVSALSKRKA